MYFFIYIDDILIINPNKYYIETNNNKLNNKEPTIKLTYELENDNSLLFQEILLINKNDKLEFKAQHKTSRRNDYIHNFSNHSDKIKRGILIGFFLRALRICSPNHFNNEFDHIKSSSRFVHTQRKTKGHKNLQTHFI